MSGAENTAPPPWLRILQLPLVRLFLLGGPIFVMMGISSGFMVYFKGEPLKAIAAVVGMASAALAFYAGWTRFIERRPLSELSFSGAGREWGIGMVIGAGLYTACILILMALGMYRIEGLNPWTFVIPAIAMALSSGFFEELFFRGCSLSLRRRHARQLDFAGCFCPRFRSCASGEPGGYDNRRDLHQH
ncbi:MAG: hypothetical protein O9342_15480 [Beijerinckiaceae bacterium]|nr:hypothetical protein [Beijerinckiaceae bacterium]